MILRSGPGRGIPGVLFAEDFDLVDSPAETPAPTLEQTPPAIEGVARDEHDRAVEAARRDGFAAGMRAVEEGREAERLALLRGIEQALRRSHEDARALADARAELIARTALSLLLGCIPAIAARFAEDELRRSLRMVLPGLVDEPHVTLAVHPDQEAEARSLAGSILGPEVRLKVLAADAMSPGDVRIQWQDGVASRDLASLRRQMSARLEALGLLLPTEQELTHAG